MQPLTKIARRTQVLNLRQVWKTEPDFSDWLVTDDGIALLAEDLGISIENARRESKPGNFPCDIVGNLVGDEDHCVVIENQYDRTDHDHLGKMLTYAAVHKAMTGIWIAEKVAEDHRAVIDWINTNTPETVSFYLAEIKAYRIGDSPVAPQLDLICRPNYMVKPPSGEMTQGELERRAWRKAFWEDIFTKLNSTAKPFKLQRAGTDHWSTISIGRSGFNVAMLLTPRNKSIGLELYISVGAWKQAAFDFLESQKQEIEAELGAQLKWMPLPTKQSARIVWEVMIDPDVPANRQAVIDWFGESVLPFYLAFRDRVNSVEMSALQGLV